MCCKALAALILLSAAPAAGNRVEIGLHEELNMTEDTKWSHCMSSEWKYQRKYMSCEEDNDAMEVACSYAGKMRPEKAIDLLKKDKCISCEESVFTQKCEGLRLWPTLKLDGPAKDGEEDQCFKQFYVAVQTLIMSTDKAVEWFHHRPMMSAGAATPVTSPLRAAAAATAPRSAARHPAVSSCTHALPRGRTSRRSAVAASAATATAAVAAGARHSLRRRGRRGALPLRLKAVGTVDTVAPPATKTRTQRLLETLPDAQDAASGAGAAGSYAGLQAIDKAWTRIKSGAKLPAPPTFVREVAGELGESELPEFDVVVCGGTLGIFVATALQRRGLRVCVLERGKLAGRAQEWNISLKEMQELVAAGALDAEDLTGVTSLPGRREVLRADDPSAMVAVHFGSVRAGFNSDEFAPSGSGDERLQEVWLDGVLNAGVRPNVAVARARARFEAAGGVVREGVGAAGIDVHSNGARVRLATEGEEESITAKLVIDAMGNQSPISRQARGTARPFGICIVVGTIATGFDLDNSFGDLIYTNNDLWTGDVKGQPDSPEEGSPRKQYYWEAFPVGSGATDRTTYLFTYMDATAERTTIEQQLEDYWDLLPTYQRHNCSAFAQGKTVEQSVVDGDLQLKRVLYGCFPTYRDSPLPPVAARMLAVGDASGIQSPLSFGGFGALTRHINRISDAVVEALSADALSKEDLATINAYLPNQSATWMFQRAMMVPIGDRRPQNFVNRLLRTNFQIMEDLGPEFLKPFNQDVVQPRALLQVLVQAVLRDPLNIPLLVYHIGPSMLADWLGHMGAMFAFDFAHHTLGGPLRAYAAGLEEAGDSSAAFRMRRLAEQWEFGSGQDYEL